MPDNEIEESISAYIGLQNNPTGNEPSISIEFNISLDIFILAYALSQIQLDCNE